MKITVQMKLAKECVSSFQYKAISRALVGSIYIDKFAFEKTPPKLITVIVE